MAYHGLIPTNEEKWYLFFNDINLNFYGPSFVGRVPEKEVSLYWTAFSREHSRFPESKDLQCILIRELL